MSHPLCQLQVTILMAIIDPCRNPFDVQVAKFVVNLRRSIIFFVARGRQVDREARVQILIKDFAYV